MKLKDDQNLTRYVSKILLSMGFRISLKGFEQLKEIIIHLCEDPTQRLSKLYKIMAKTQRVTLFAIERNIRVLIKDNEKINLKIKEVLNHDISEFVSNKDVIVMLVYYISNSYDAGFNEKM